MPRTRRGEIFRGREGWKLAPINSFENNERPHLPKKIHKTTHLSGTGAVQKQYLYIHTVVVSILEFILICKTHKPCHGHTLEFALYTY